MALDSLVASQAAAARNGYVASNWAGGDGRFDLATAGATARLPFDAVIKGFYGIGAVFDRGKVLLGRDQSTIMSFSVGRALAAVARDNDALVKASIPLKSQDTLTVLIDNDNNSEIDQVILMLQKGKITPPRSNYAKVFPTVAAGAITSTAHVWTSGNITLEATLDPTKMYDVLGMANNEATSGAARLISKTPQTQDDPRPTIVSGLTGALATMQYFDDVLTFRGDRVPTLEVLDNTSASVQQLTLLLGEHP